MNLQYLCLLIKSNEVSKIATLFSPEKAENFQILYKILDRHRDRIVAFVRNGVFLQNFQLVEISLTILQNFTLEWKSFSRQTFITEALLKAVYLNDRLLINLLWEDLLNEYAIEELSNMTLNSAIAGSHEFLVIELLKLSADVNYININSYGHASTPLMIAAAANNVGMLELLISHGADPKLGFDDGSSWCSALISAMWEDTPDTFQYLLNFYKDDSIFINDLLKSAISCCDVNFSLVEQLVIGGCDVNAKFEGGGTPLIAAVRSGFAKPIQFLVESGAHVNLADNRGLTPLLWATYYDLKEAIDYLNPLTSPETKNLIQKQLSDELALEKQLFTEIIHLA